MTSSDGPVGVFDSGFGGLTVLQAMRRIMPQERYMYLADTLRLPYGLKSPDIVRRYSLEAAAHLIDAGVKALVIACNTASIAGLDAVQTAWPDMPIIGVVKAGVRQALRASRNGRFVVTGTLGTIRSGAYQRMIEEGRPGSVISGVPCPMFVFLVEEGWMDGPVAEAAVERYLGCFAQGPEENRPDVLVMGCTHFPFLAGAIQKVMGPGVTLVDAAALTAQDMHEILTARGMLSSGGPGEINPITYCTSGDPERFAEVGSIFMGSPIAVHDVRVVSLGQC